MTLSRAVASISAGLLFGLLLQKGGMFHPSIIKGQLELRDWTMFKMWISASGSSILCQVLLSLVGGSKLASTLQAVRVDNASVDRGILAVALGCAGVGFGMGLSGACPGTVWVQFASGLLRPALITVFGALFGAWAYAQAHETVRSKVFPVLPLAGNKEYLEYWLGAAYRPTATVLGLLMISLTLLVDRLQPSSLDPLNLSLSAANWHPITAGLLLGPAQWPLMVFLTKSIGAATTYTILASNLLYSCAPAVAKKNTYTMKYVTSTFKGWWQPSMHVSSIVGAFLSSVLGGTNVLLSSGAAVPAAPSALLSFAGGFIMLFGARAASGCTSGHGISGISSLSVKSMIGAAAMFVGGVAGGLLSASA